MAKKKKPKTEKDTPIAFEEAFSELQEIVGQLEDGQLTLGQSLSQYEKGIARLRECYQALGQAEQKIKMLVNLDEDGNLVTTDFKSDTASAAKRKETAGRKNKSASNPDDDNDSVDADNSLF